MIIRGVGEHRPAELAEIVLAFEARGALPCREEHGDEDGDEHADDGDDDQELDESGCARGGSWRAHRSLLQEDILRSLVANVTGTFP